MGVHLPDKTKPLAASVEAHSARATPSASGRTLLTRTGFRSHRKTESSSATALYSLPGWEVVASDQLRGARVFSTPPESWLHTSLQQNEHFLATEQTRGLWPSLDSFYGASLFNAENATTRWDAFCASGSRYALTLQ